MTSVRLGKELERLLERATRASGVSHSEFIREAVSKRCQEVLAPTLADRMQAVIGVVESNGGRADNTGSAFQTLLRRKRSE